MFIKVRVQFDAGGNFGRRPVADHLTGGHGCEDRSGYCRVDRSIVLWIGRDENLEEQGCLELRSKTMDENQICTISPTRVKMEYRINWWKIMGNARYVYQSYPLKPYFVEFGLWQICQRPGWKGIPVRTNQRCETNGNQMTKGHR